MIASLLVLTLLAAPSLGSAGVVWTEQAKLIATDGNLNDRFGQGVAIEGDTAVVGAPSVDDPTANGAAYVFLRDSVTGTWSQEQKLTATDGAADDEFGYSVAISYDTIVVGARRDNIPPLAVDAGSAYVFVRDSITGAWVQQAKLTASDGAAFDEFGRSVAISYDTVVVGARFHAHALLADTGAAYVFVRDSTTGDWSEQQELRANDGGSGDEFGHSVTIDDGTIVVGARYDDRSSAETNLGAAYVFVWCPDTEDWRQQQKLTPSDGAEFDEFGSSVDVQGNTAWVGAPFADLDTLSFNAGSAYVFVRDPWTAIWTEQQKVIASDESSMAEFGRSIALDYDTVVIGAERDPGGGSAYVFVQDPWTGTWAEQTKLAASDRASGDQFGQSVGISYDTIVVGAPFHDGTTTNFDQGSAYVFVRVCDGCTAPADSPGDSATAAPWDVYVHGHQEDWQLFESPNSVNDIGAGDNLLFIYMTAGDAGSDSSYWGAREEATMASVRYIVGDANEVAGLMTTCYSDSICHDVWRIDYGRTVSIFMRLPDGNMDGSGYSSTGFESLAKLRDGGISSITAVDGSTTYTSWADVYRTLEAIVITFTPYDSSTWINTPDYDRDVQTTQDAGCPGCPDHSDHLAVADAVYAITIGTGAPWSTAWFVDYPIGYGDARYPPNLDSDGYQAKKDLFMVYNERFLELTGIDTYAQQPAFWENAFQRDYFRVA